MHLQLRQTLFSKWASHITHTPVPTCRSSGCIWNNKENKFYKDTNPTLQSVIVLSWPFLEMDLKLPIKKKKTRRCVWQLKPAELSAKLRTHTIQVSCLNKHQAHIILVGTYSGLIINCTGLWIKGSGFEPWLENCSIVFLGKTLGGGGGEGGPLGIFWVGMCCPGLQIGTPF